MRIIGIFLFVAMIAIWAGCIQTTRYVYLDQNGNQVVDPSRYRRIEVTIPEAPADADPNSFAGTWSSPLSALQEIDNRQIELVVGDSRSMFVARSEQVAGLPIGRGEAPISFTLQRRAGQFQFTGEVAEGRASGKVVFAIDPAYRERMATLSQSTIDMPTVVQLVQADLPFEVVAELNDAGYHFSIDDIIKLRRSGVPAQFSVDMKKGGYDFSADDLIRVHNSGVTAKYAAELKTGGFDLDAPQLIQLRNSGVDASYAVQVRATGLAKQPAEIIRLRNSGVSSQFVKSLADGGMNFSVDDIIRLRNSGISSDYVIALSKAGYRLGAADLVRLRNGGVDSKYAVALVVPGKENLGVDEIIRLRQRGVDAETVQKLRK